MAQYIDKSAVVAEIERIMAEEMSFYKDCCKDELENTSSAVIYMRMKKLLSFLDTLEVKDVDLKNSMVCKVDWYDGFLLDYTQEQQDELLEKIGADVGDKITVILIKE